MIEFVLGSSSIEALQPFDPALVAEIDDLSLQEALKVAGLADRIILVTELLQRGLQI